MADFDRFPHTPHIVWLGQGTPRDDKVLSATDVAALLSDEVIVEEKIDGANLGFSVDERRTLRAQNHLNQPPPTPSPPITARWALLHAVELQGVAQRMRQFVVLPPSTPL